MWPPTSCEEVGGHIVCTVDYRINSDQISSRSTSRLIGLSAGYGTGGAPATSRNHRRQRPSVRQGRAGTCASASAARPGAELLKHEAGVRQQAYRERRGTIGAADAHAVAVIVGNLGPTHILMVARLLRHEVRRMIRESVGAPHAELGVFAVQVRLRRAGAEEPQVRVLHRQRPFDAERRDGGQVTLLSRVFDVQVHAAIGVGRVGDGHLGALRGGELIRVRALSVLSSICSSTLSTQRA